MHACVPACLCNARVHACLSLSHPTTTAATTTATQPVGTAGAAARWGSTGATMWPALSAMTDAMVASVQEGKTTFDVHAWEQGFFRPRYTAWKQGGPAITADEAVEAFKAAYVA